ncbi:MAG: thiamine-monophosphate kinase [Candidatus Omnitrophica bacterium CG11_big_fil_rev_8_21_14_0_20_45_26]|uniref:Thiamine-monophosphate kinase n=1 Tax=Candidatus Abzuiibacterium crystallinum TaxID=1974748 RepID=A0A2H0LPP1_9BACT|nr:MAG: thiamine-monophosphate kinase [Candidatus Omnitrophica bacterium CG11_big_fil_rev_8_21_14_0_20_45_26]PIW63535.1 MAG: thiamine-monophosphate kinase [Candidatus Omnitrophica bacterium CG12_big_fil_rev_8_21_14_0_65_45_16]
MTERELLKEIKTQFKTHFPVTVGIGDDAAVLRQSKAKKTLLAVDLMVENIDFTFEKITPEAVGRKALAVNLSDIAAMGGKPAAAVVGLVLPRKVPVRRVKRFMNGLKQMARQSGVVVAGGDLSRGPCWMISVTITGEMKKNIKPVCRSGGRAGDVIAVTGELGGSIEKKHWAFTPRLKEGAWLAERGVHAMMDVSDGLLQDLDQLLLASGTAASIDFSCIPISKTAKHLSRSKEEALGHALSDGEDFELLFTVSAHQWEKIKADWRKHFKTPLTQIGRVVGGKPCIYFKYGQKPVMYRPKQKGYDHFS